VDTRTISILDLSPADEAAWRDLGARSVEPNPFYEIDFVVPACRHLSGGNDVALVVAEDGGQFHACVPVKRVKVLAAVRPPVISSWLHLYSFLGTPLVDREGGVDAVAALLSALRRHAGWPGIVILRLFADDGPVAVYLRRAADELGLAVHTYESGERVVFHCHDEQTVTSAPKVHRERRAKARQWRRLCDEWGEPAVVDRADDPEGHAAFLALESAGWKGRAATALASRPSDAAFYREVTTRFRDSGRLCLYSLEAGGNTLAMQTNFRSGSALFDWKVAYDEQFARYSPGAQLQLQVLEAARRDGLSLIDSCADVADEHQQRLSAARRRIATLAIVGDGRLSRAALASAVLLVKTQRKLRALASRPRR
jgi:CelD/BcsL family acetyltransferase involved in cellulose biosynthesis